MLNSTLSGGKNHSAAQDRPGSSDLQLGGDVFLAYSVIVAVMTTAVSMLYILTIIALCSVRSMAKTLQIFLINLFSAGLATAVFVALYPLSTLTINWAGIQEPSLAFCRFMVWGYSGGAIARLFSMAAFAVAVLLVVRYSAKALKYAPIVLTLVLLWLGAILLNTHLLVPPIYAVQYVDGLACFPGTVDAKIIRPARYTFTAIWILLGGVSPVVVSIVVPILVLCYIKRNRVSKGSNYDARLAKFALFLLSGSFISILGQTVIGAIVYFSGATPVYIAFVVGTLSLLPTPLLIMAYLKQVRQRMRAMLSTSWQCCYYYKTVKERKLLIATSDMACKTLEQPYSAFHNQDEFNSPRT